MDIEANFVFQQNLLGHKGSVSAVRFQPVTGNILASCSGDETIQLWHPSQGVELKQLKGHNCGLNDLFWRGDGKGLCSASNDCTIGIWDVQTGTMVQQLKEHADVVTSVRYGLQDINVVVSGSFDDTVRLWDTRRRDSVRVIKAHSDPVTSVDINSEETLISSSSLDGLLRVWDYKDGNSLKAITEESCPPLSFARFTPNGKFLLIMRLDGVMMLMDVVSNEVKRRYVGHENRGLCLIPAITNGDAPSCNRWLVSGCEDGCIGVWDVQRRKRGSDHHGVVQMTQRIGNYESSVHGHRQAVLCIDAHPTSPLIASGASAGDCLIKLWKDSPGDL